jgi:hypothetical protein
MKRWIAYHNGVGEHSFVETHREGPFPNMMSALRRLEELQGVDWVEENVLELVASDLDGTIAWVDDEHGISVHASPDP